MVEIADSNKGGTDSDFLSLERTLENMSDFLLLIRRQNLSLLQSVADAWIQCEAARKKPAVIDEPYRGKIFPFGPYCQGINTKDDDNGVLLIAPKWISKKSFSLLFAEMLKFRKSVEYVSRLKNPNLIRTKIAGISFHIFLAKLNVDNVSANYKLSETTDASLFIDFVNEKRICGIINASLMLTMVYSKQVFKTALKTIKVWANECGIFSNTLRYLNNFNLTIMVSRICQLFPLEPAERIVYHFFRIYSQWNWSEPILMNSSVFLQTSRNANKCHRFPTADEERASKVNIFIRFGGKMHILCRMIKYHGFKRILSIMNREHPWSFLFERKTFFHTYSYYSAITFSCPNEQTFDMWSPEFKTYVRDRATLYEKKLNVEYVHINCRDFDETIKKDDGPCYAKTWFIGVKLSGLPDNFEDNLEDSIHDCKVSIKSFKNCQITKYLPKELLRSSTESTEEKEKKN